MKKTNQKDYYVYVLQNPKKPLRFKTDKYGLEYEPFYVGKGKGGRSDVHLSSVLKRDTAHNSRLWAEISMIQSYGMNPVVTKLYINLDEDKAYELESEVITHYGVRYKDGLLVNASFGKAGGWGGYLNPTYHRMKIGTHNFQTSNPQFETPKVKKLKKMILEIDTEASIKDPKWLKRTGYSDIRALKIGITRILSREPNLPYRLESNKIKRTKK